MTAPTSCLLALPSIPPFSLGASLPLSRGASESPATQRQAPPDLAPRLIGLTQGLSYSAPLFPPRPPPSHPKGLSVNAFHPSGARFNHVLPLRSLPTPAISLWAAIPGPRKVGSRAARPGARGSLSRQVLSGFWSAFALTLETMVQPSGRACAPLLREGGVCAGGHS